MHLQSFGIQLILASFPEMCASLTLCNVPPPTEYVRVFFESNLTYKCYRLKYLFTAYDELSQAMCYATDLDSFEQYCMESAKFIIGTVSGHRRVLLVSSSVIE